MEQPHRLEALRQYADGVLAAIPVTVPAADRQEAVTHTYGVAQLCALLAQKRGLPAELAVMAGLLHDLAQYQTLASTDHAARGAALARQVLDELALTTPAETEAICTAIAHHSDKENQHDALSEVLKDADVWQRILFDPVVPVAKPARQARYAALCAEFGLPTPL